MSSKLSYLSKYLDDSSNKEDKKKRDKKTKKKKKSRRDEDEDDRLIVKDEDDLVDMVTSKKNDERRRMDPGASEEDEEDQDDDGPVIVNQEEIPSSAIAADRTSLRGHWEDIKTDNAAVTTVKSAARTSASRQRYDTSDEEENANESQNQHKQTIARKRYDSDSSGSSSGQSSRGKKHSSRTTKARKKERKQQRYDSEDSSQEEHSRKRPRRHDLDNEERPIKEEEPRSNGTEARGIKIKEEPSVQRRRYDSSSEDEAKDVKPKKKYDSSSEEEEEEEEEGKRKGEKKEKPNRMSSGHEAGLQTGQGFAKAEADIQEKRKVQAQEMVDRYGMGETVHRGSKESASGRKVVLSAEQQADLNQGRYQKEKAAQEREQFERIQQSAFARRVDDDEIEALRKEAIRPGDPMARYAVSRQSSKKAKGSRQQQSSAPRPVYKGPPPKPNRFGIRPGFRWDGNDRGNGFEDRLLAQRSNQAQRKEEAYRWSSSGM